LRRFRSKLFLSILWLIFTVTFAGWWFVLEKHNVDRLAEIDTPNRETYIRQRRMILWEGISWEILLFAGGATLIYLVSRERSRHAKVKEFFASFSHDVKTSLASLRLQAEALNEDLGAQETPLLARLISDTVRLQLQLENSLYFASEDSMTLFMTDVDFGKVIESVRHQWPMLKIILKGNAVKIKADERALRSVVSNLIQNSLIHGKAKTLTFEFAGDAILFYDDGAGFIGNLKKLARIYHRPTPTSGSGLGLYIAKSLLQKMQGDLELSDVSGNLNGAGFGGQLRFKLVRS
jgi:signal transduction histidine kinase